MNRPSAFIAAICLGVVLCSCTTPTSRTKAPALTYDKDTKYDITASDKGFGVTVYYSRYQYLPESDTVALVCKSQATAIAWEHAEKLGRKITPINEQRIRISMGRNDFTGITSCQASVAAEWAS